MVEAIEDAIDFVCTWKQSREIAGVMSVDKITIITDNFKNTSEKWLFHLRIIGERNKTLQICFKVSTFSGLKKLVIDQMQQCKEINKYKDKI